MRIDLESMTPEQYDRYRLLCDSRSSAEFRFRREICGIELSELAEDLGVRLDTAKRWENPKKGYPPSLRAWAYVDSAYDKVIGAVDAAIAQVEEIIDEHGELGAIHIAYRRGNQPTRDGETVGRANAAARAAGLAFTALGYEIAVEWADEGTAGIAAAAGRS